MSDPSYFEMEMKNEAKGWPRAALDILGIFLRYLNLGLCTNSVTLPKYLPRHGSPPSPRTPPPTTIHLISSNILITSCISLRISPLPHKINRASQEKKPKKKTENSKRGTAPPIACNPQCFSIPSHIWGPFQEISVCRAAEHR